MKIKLLSTLVLIGLSQILFAYPISPRPLRKLIIESEYIVYADVHKVKNMATDDFWQNTKAILIIKEILKGKINKDTITVYFASGMICPSPAHYQVGTTVLAFLNNDKERDGFSTHALSYGAKTLTEASYNIYRSRIMEMQDILKIKPEKQRISKTIDWLVSCAADPKTRWEGVYELSPESNFMSYYDQDKETFIRKYKLNKGQLSILRKTFFSIDRLDYSDIGLMDLVVRPDDKELFNFLVKKLKEAELKRLWFASFLITRIAEMADREDLRKIVAEIENLGFMEENREEKAAQLTKKFIEKI